MITKSAWKQRCALNYFIVELVCKHFFSSSIKFCVGLCKPKMIFLPRSTAICDKKRWVKYCNSANRIILILLHNNAIGLQWTEFFWLVFCLSKGLLFQKQRKQQGNEIICKKMKKELQTTHLVHLFNQMYMICKSS